jgi:pyridoxal 5'-phosphate synthase pdxS subunit
MALERIPSDIRKDGGVARMTDPKLIKEIQAAVRLVQWSLLSCG